MVKTQHYVIAPFCLLCVQTKSLFCLSLSVNRPLQNFTSTNVNVSVLTSSRPNYLPLVHQGCVFRVKCKWIFYI